MRKSSAYKVMKKTVVGITIVGKDREGIVATFTNFAFSKGGNIEKVNQNVIKGLFGMYLEVSFSKSVDIEKFDSEIQGLAKKEKMDVSIHHETNSQKNIAVLVTKEPLCLETILANSKSLKGKISVVIGTQKTLEPLAKKANIPFVLVEEKTQQDAEEKIIEICKKYNIDLISLARYMRILSPNFVWRYPNRIINIHPSLLPAFPGASAYAQAYERGTKIVGVTSHYVTENLDQGPIIFQDSFNVDPTDTLEKIKTKGQRLEANMLLKAMKMHLENKLEVRWRKVHIKSK
jgi:formyltetrahydrofolate deformylase